MYAITESEATRLAALERVVRKGQKAFFEIGAALKEIRDSKLYKATHKTFAAYVEERFEFKRHNAYHLIEAAEVAGNVEHVQQIENPRQASEVAKAPADKQAEVIDVAVELAAVRGCKPTAKTFREARESVLADDSGDEYEDVDDEYEDVDDFDDVTGRLTSLRPLIESLEPHELIVVQDWISGLLGRSE